MSETEVRERHKRHGDDTWIDQIRITTVPRFKTSGLSGDEWRISVRVELLRKGRVLKARDFGRMAWAVMHLPAMMCAPCPAEQPWPRTASPGFSYGDGYMCDQPGCDMPGTERRTLIHEYDNAGNKIPAKDWSPVCYRVFCLTHATRGDCALEDADPNYAETAEDPL